MPARLPESERDSFAALAARVVVGAHLAEAAEPILAKFALELTREGRRSLLYLHDGLVEVAATPAESRASVLGELFRSLLGVPHHESWKSAQTTILPVIRNRWFGGDALASRSWIHSDLAAFLTLGGGAYVSLADLRAWSVEADAAFGHAFQNLARHRVEETTGERGERRIRLGNAEPSAAILSPEILEVPQGTMAAMPERGVLFLVDSDDGAIAEDVFRAWDAAAQPISPVLHGGERELRNAALALRAETYAAQARALEGRGLGVEIPLAEHLRDPEYLLCTWSEGVDALLPEVSMVVLRPKKGRGARDVSWHSLTNVIGSTFLSAEPGLFPPRWRARAWSRKQLESYDQDDDAFFDEIASHDPEEDLRAPMQDEDPGPVPEPGLVLESNEPPEDEYGDESSEPDDDRYAQQEEREETPPPLSAKERADLRRSLETSLAGTATHALAFLEALLQAGELELTGRHALPAVERAVADVLDAAAGDWPRAARSLSRRLVEMPEVAELFADDEALAATLRRTAPATIGAETDHELSRARLFVHDLLDRGGAELVDPAALETVEDAVADVLRENGDAAMMHARLDAMDDALILYADAKTLAALLAA